MTLTHLAGAIVVGGLIQLVATWWLLRGLRRLDRIDARIGHLTEALRLLAETTEAGFRASAAELGRIAEQAAPASAPADSHAAAPAGSLLPAPRTRARRATASPRKAARPAAAARAEMSESEARLRQLLAGSGAATAGAPREAGRGTLRA